MVLYVTVNGHNYQLMGENVHPYNSNTAIVFLLQGESHVVCVLKSPP